MSGDYTSENIRFTQKENCVFAIQLGWAGANQRIAIKSLGRKLGGHLQIKNVTVLDSPRKLIGLLRMMPICDDTCSCTE